MRLLSAHPAIAQVAVIGVPDEGKGEVIKAFVVPKDGDLAAFDREGLIAWAKENMSHYKVPRQLELREALPATGTGKVLRRLLKG